jgi:hypothetical protein
MKSHGYSFDGNKIVESYSFVHIFYGYVQPQPSGRDPLVPVSVLEWCLQPIQVAM